MYVDTEEDIAGTATPEGGAQGMLRLSGPGARGIIARAALDLPSDWNTAPLRRGVFSIRLLLELSVYGPDGTQQTVQEPCPALLLCMPGPRSYTRQDTAEILLPGSPAVLRAGMRALVRAGARPALPGEFTFRAFAAGRITLGQAEAVEEIVRGGGSEALARLQGSSADRLRQWRDTMLDLAARLEAALDFEEETGPDAAAGLAEAAAALEQSGIRLDTDHGAAEQDTADIAFTGLVNAGKSSLFNALLPLCAPGQRPALVSARPATTRDSLARPAAWKGAEFVLCDNPGVQTDGTELEQAVSARARLGPDNAAVRCWVLDASKDPGPAEAALAQTLRAPTVIALSKADLPAHVSADAAAGLARSAGWAPAAVVRTSAAAGTGLTELLDALAGLARGTDRTRSAWNKRERLELTRALEHCRRAADELAGAARLELAADDIRAAAESFARALGEGYAQDTLDRIFSTFCIGK